VHKACFECNISTLDVYRRELL